MLVRVRNVLKQVSASTPPRAAAMLSPEVSRSLVHRLASSRSQGWVTRSNRSRARGQGRPAGMVIPGSLCSRHTSRGYSISQPVPSRSDSSALQASIRNRAASLTWEPALCRHCCSLRSSSELTPAALTCRTAGMTRRGAAVRERASARHCRAYWISSFSCGERSWRSMQAVPVSSQSAMKRAGSGRPCRCHRSSWPVQKIFAGLMTHRSQNGRRHSAAVGSPGARSGASQVSRSGFPARSHRSRCLEHSPFLAPRP